MRIMEKTDSTDYIRVGINFYRLVFKPLLSGDKILTYIKWNYNTLKLDRVIVDDIKYYHDFIVYPEHINYKQEIGGFYNKYSELESIPLPNGSCSKILGFLSHIFGDQLQIGLDYLKIIYEYPTQILPILCLVSEKRNTGKTTLLNFLKLIYGANMAINTNDDFRSQFNSSWLHCVIVGVDEVLLDKKEDSERIKNLSTARTYKIESKGIDKSEVEFFGKFILCSNNTKNFIKIDKNETRYWVREIPVLEFDNKDMLAELKKEVPYFLQFLLDRDFAHPRQTRMWFTPDQLRTKALERVMFYNSSSLELEFYQILNHIMEIENVTEINFSRHDVLNWLISFNIKNRSLQNIKILLQGSMKLKPKVNTSTYVQYSLGANGEVVKSSGKARFYTITETDIQIFDDFDD